MRSETRVLVKRPPGEIWAFLTDRLNLPRWARAWRGAYLSSPAPIGLGTTFEGRAVILGVKVGWRGLVTEWDPPHTFAYSVKVLGARSDVRISLETTAAGTEVVKRYGREPRLFQKLAAAIFGPWLRRSHDARDKELKRLLEARFGG